MRGTSSLLEYVNPCRRQGAPFPSGSHVCVKRRISNREERKWAGKLGQPGLQPWEVSAVSFQKVECGGCPACSHRPRWSLQPGWRSPWAGQSAGRVGQAAGPQAVGMGQACAQSLGSLSPDRPPWGRRCPHHTQTPVKLSLLLGSHLLGPLPADPWGGGSVSSHS